MQNIKTDADTVKTERVHLSHGRNIRVVSVFPLQGCAAPEDKLKALVDMELQRQKLCA